MDKKKLTIARGKFKRLGLEWTKLDNEYDALFQEFLNNPTIKMSNELKRFKAMQKRLYAIENELYKVAEGEASIKGIGKKYNE